MRGTISILTPFTETIEPFAALCATARVKKYMAYPESSRFFSENIEVTNGEGNLSFEAGFIYGLKLHGKVRAK
jgi:hypothetical protein